MTTRVFLSHSVSAADRPLLREVERACGEDDIRLYLAEREFAPTTVTEKLRGAIATSDFVVVLITDSSASSTWVSAELAIATELAKPIIPLVEQGVQPPGILEGRDQIRFQRGDFRQAFERATRFILGHKESETPENPGQDGFETGLVVGVAITTVVVLVLIALTEK